ncbi:MULTISPECIES: glycosyltransferase family 2 protein [unclassified Thermotoga]|uniref:glycosyltransferase family 2 protein n=1 Tax=unclassified Thermotoga TaxID=2631113 RepID=UPI000280E894|nr:MULTISPECIES: glycosyltransferase family 2 protein [unclassified Thermotoga]AIY85723.1 glycosyl transferase family 2 [Thermotoga sp. 2812B]EJX26989.1 glycosyl transferase family 2 [Thermotoga sp. EMP]KHC90228.1 glycosyl transferase family 2 [Thermotoga sp. Mc24]
MRKCLLSVAMIVKDEEHNIRRALESIKDVVDEIVVVDTGSKDRTPEIVREYTDKLYFHEWKNDFSEARNFSLKFPTCEWILILDADEEASEEFRQNIRSFLESLSEDVNTVYLPTVSYLDWDFKKTEIASTPRIFRNGTVYYKNIVHNQAIYKPKVVHAPFRIYHYGYIWTRKLKKKKYERTGTLIREHLKNVKDPVEKIYYLIQLYKTKKIGGKKHEENKIAWETLQEIMKIGKIPAIGLEFLYIFGMELILNGFLEKGEELIDTAIKAFPENPDPYFAKLAIYERRKDWENLYQWGKKFLDVLNKALSQAEKYEFTITTIKEIGTAHLLMCHACVKLKKWNEAYEHLLKAIENDIDESKFILTLQIVSEISEKEDFQKVLKLIEKIAENSENLFFDEIVEKIAEFEIEASEKLLNKLPVSRRISKFILKRLVEKKDFLFEYLTNEDINSFVGKTGIPGLLFIFDLLREKETEGRLIRILSKIEGDEKLNGIIQALIGDLYLKLGNFSEAISRYRKTLELAPEIASFIKPVIEDLKTRLDPDIEGVYEELYRYFSGYREFPFNILEFAKEDAEKLYLISDHPLAIYTSAVAVFQKSKEKARTLLERIKDISKLPFYYYRLAKTWEEENPLKAFELHIKAVEENENLGDIALGRYKYNGLYPNQTFPFMKKEDEIIWVGNITERFSGFGAIHPVRAWKRKENFYYALPYPSDEALKLYKEREKEIMKEPPFKVKEEHIIEALLESDIRDLRIKGEAPGIESVLKDLEIELKENSKNFLVVSGVEETLDLNKLVENAERVLLFFFVPDLNDRNNPVWYYPGFRVLRTTHQMRKTLENLRFSVVKVRAVDKNLRFIEAFRRV